MPANRRIALRDVLAAVYALLNVSAVTTLAPGGVHHGQAPENVTADYLVLQSPLSDRWDSMQENGEHVTFRTDSVCLGADYGNALAIRAAAIPLVDNQRLSITAHHFCVVCRWLGSASELYRDPDTVNGQVVWHAIDQFEVLVEQTS